MADKRRLLLICGIPGTGKTTLGEHLERMQGFVHINRERFRWQGTPRGLVGQFRALNQDAVITWGFWPGRDDPEVRELQAAGFRMVWFDGDRAAALKYFLRRGDVPESLFHQQIARIDTLDLTSFGAWTIDPFDHAGNLRPVEGLARDVLQALRT